MQGGLFTNQQNPGGGMSIFNNMGGGQQQQQQQQPSIFANQQQQQQQPNVTGQQQYQQGGGVFANQPQQGGNIFGNNQPQQNALFQQQPQQQQFQGGNNMFQQQPQQQQPNMNVFNNMVPSNNLYGMQNNQQQQMGNNMMMGGGGLFQQRQGMFPQQQQQPNYQQQGRDHSNHSLSYFPMWSTDGVNSKIREIFDKPTYTQSRNEFLASKGVNSSTYYLINSGNNFASKRLGDLIKEGDQASQALKNNQPQNYMNMNKQNFPIECYHIIKKMKDVFAIIQRNKVTPHQQKRKEDIDQIKIVVSHTIHNLDLFGNNPQPQLGQQQLPPPQNFFKNKVNIPFLAELQDRCLRLIESKDCDISIQGLNKGFIKLNEERNQIVQKAASEISSLKNKSISQSKTLYNILILTKSKVFNQAMAQDCLFTLEKFHHSAYCTRVLPNPFIFRLLNSNFLNDIMQIEKRIGELEIITDEKQEFQEYKYIENDTYQMIESILALQEYFKVLSGNTQQLHRLVDDKFQQNQFQRVSQDDEYSQQKLRIAKTNQKLFKKFKECEQSIENLKKQLQIRNEDGRQQKIYGGY